MKWYVTVALPFVSTREQAEAVRHQLAAELRLPGYAVRMDYPVNLQDFELSFELEEGE